MNLRRTLALSLLVASVPAGLIRGAPTAPWHHAPPDLRVDDSPVGPTQPGGPVTSYADVLGPVQKAVVSVYSTKMVRGPAASPLLRKLFPNLSDTGEETPQQGLGSGVIVTPDGYILTNNHVVEGADELKVSLSDGREFTASVVGTDPKTDVAVIKIDANHLPVVTLADSDKLRVGDIVFAVGNPLDVGQTVTMGIVSAKNRTVKMLDEVGAYEDYIQTDAAINLGNSGGALVDARGRLIGINSAILSPSRGNIGIGFAIPVNLAASVMRSLVETGTVTRGFLGVTSETVSPNAAEQLGLSRDTKGVVVSDIVAGSPAEKGGLKRSDVIVAVNGRPVSSLDELRLTIAEMAPGTRAALGVLRQGRARTVEVTLGRFAEHPNELFTGVTVRPLDADDRLRLALDGRVSGLLITHVAADSPYRDRLAVGTVIMAINRTAVREVGDARELIQPGRNLLAVYVRGAAHFVVIRQG